MFAVFGFFCNCRKVVGPSMAGIMTSSRIASGRSRSARSIPCKPEFARKTSHPATVSRLSPATWRMSSSSSMMSMRLVICAGHHKRRQAGDCRCRSVHVLWRHAKHGKHQCLYLLCLHACLGQEVGGTELQLRAFRFAEVSCGVDEQRQGVQPRMMTQPLHQAESVAVRESHIQNHEVGSKGGA